MLFKLSLIVLFGLILGYQEYRIYNLDNQINIVYNQQKIRDRRNKLEETDFIRTAKNSILILKCTDTTTPNKSWIASAVKSHPTHIVTVFHNISDESNKMKRTYPISCNLTQENIKMGEFKIKSDQDAKSYQIGERDIAIIPVIYTKEGDALPNLVPKKAKVTAGDVVSLLSSPAKFHLDATVSFGVVLSNSIKYSMIEDYKTFWHDAISSDIIASAGSSGGALIHFGKEAQFIGIHVGNNQLTGLYLAYYQLLFDDLFFERFNNLK
jgi:hypothetical protein